MEQAGQMVAFGHADQRFHDDLVIVRCQIGGGEYRREFVLGGGDFVVSGLAGDAERPQFVIHIAHKVVNPGAQPAEIVIAHILAFGRIGAKEGAPGHDEILALFIHVAVDEEIFLFGADGSGHLFHVGFAEEL